MPGYRRKRYKRRSRRQFTGRKRFGIRRFPYAKTIYRGTNRMELKFRDNVFTEATLPVAGMAFLLNGINEGVKADQRIGQSVTVKSISIRIDLDAVAATVAVVNYVADIIWDKQPNGTLATMGQIYDFDDNLSHRNLDQRSRFRTIATTGTFKLGSFDDNNLQEGVSWQWYVQMNAMSSFSGTDASIGSISSGSLLLTIRNSNGVAGAGHMLEMRTRLRYNEGEIIGGFNANTFGTAKMMGGQSVLGGYKRG